MMLARLLKVSAIVHQRDKDFETALHVASRLGNTNGAYSLLNAGSAVDALSAQQWTPLRLSCRYGHADITRMLLDFGADANKPGLFGWTALQYASQNGHKDCMKVLLEYGANDTISRQSPRNTAADGLKQRWGIYKFSRQL
jgi:ankyrin repeat protein